MPHSADFLLDEIRMRVDELEPEKVYALLEADASVVLLDVREREELDDGAIPGSLHVPRSFIELLIEEAIPQRNTRIVAYCSVGVRSLLIIDNLKKLGYENISSMAGGYSRWKERGLPVSRHQGLSEAEARRYRRHLIIPEVGEAGQIKLMRSKVLVVGAGGLGSPAAYYLAAAGIGTLGIVDFDVVEESNLQRQILHSTDRVGMLKTRSAQATLSRLNPAITVVPHEVRLSSENVEGILSAYDIVVDGTDNFATRYLINDACVKLGLPCVHGSVFRFDGQVTVFDPPRGPCYRCLYPEPPPPGMVPSCAEAGVLGVLPGVIGALQAVEVIKQILGVGDSLAGRLLQYDGLRGEFCSLNIRRDPNCRYCSDGATFPGFIDYEQFCSNVQTR